MLKKSFLGLFVGLFLSIAMSNVSAKIVQRIVGGNFAPRGRFKHQVSLQMIGQDCTIHQCGGSIIDAIHIITAAHCVINDYNEFQNYNITIMAGTTDLRNKSSGIYRDVEYTIVPTSYNSKGTVDDIAILRLKRPLPLKSESHRIRAANLPADDYRYKPPNTKIAIVSGFGSHKQKWNSQSGKIESGPLSPRLKFATGLINKIEPQFGCRDTEVCVLNNNSHGACHGDSGGPLIDPSTNTLIGVVSYSNHKWCGKTTKYTRVSSYLDFINKVRAGGLMDRNFISILHQNFDNEKIVGQLPSCT